MTDTGSKVTCAVLCSNGWTHQCGNSVPSVTLCPCQCCWGSWVQWDLWNGEILSLLCSPSKEADYNQRTPIFPRKCRQPLPSLSCFQALCLTHVILIQKAHAKQLPSSLLLEGLATRKEESYFWSRFCEELLAKLYFNYFGSTSLEKFIIGASCAWQ